MRTPALLPCQSLAPHTHLRAELVHHMPKLMEVGLHLIMLQQGGGIRGGLGEVGHHGCNGDLAAPVLSQTAGLQAKAGCVPILAFPGSWGREEAGSGLAGVCSACYLALRGSNSRLVPNSAIP